MSSALQNWTNGFTDAASQPHHFHNGLPFEADGTIAVDFSQPITHYSQGLPFTSTNRLNCSVFAVSKFAPGASPRHSGNSIGVKGSGAAVAHIHGIRYSSDKKVILSPY